MAGVAGHAGLADMGRPFRIDLMRHLQHAPGDDFGIDLIGRHILNIMAIAAALIGRDPFRHGQHDAVELRFTHVTQHLHILIGFMCPWPSRIGRFRCFRCLIGCKKRRKCARVLHLTHRKPTEAALRSKHRWTFEGGDEDHTAQQRHHQGRDAESKLVAHRGAPCTMEGSTAGVQGIV